MAMIRFTANHTDHSNATGYQFQFHCDKCGNGYMSKFQPSALGMASGVVGAAGAFFGGLLGRAAYGTQKLNDAFRGKARDDAFAVAVEEAKHHFHQCSRCGKWVCPEACWNEKRSLCEGCAPDLAEETAAAQAQAAAEQVREKARKTDLVKDVDMSREAAANCPSCNARVGAAKFCPECGFSINPKIKCPGCKAEIDVKAKFCPECGHRR